MNWVKEGVVWCGSVRFVRVSTASKGRDYLTKLSSGSRVRLKGSDGKICVINPGDKVAFVVTWGLLDSIANELCAWFPDLFVADEAHNAKDSSSLRGCAFIRVAHASSGVVAATGTPLRNRHAEAWALLHAVDPISWPSEPSFQVEFCVPKKIKTGYGEITMYSGSRNEHLLNKLTRSFVLRREKRDVLPDLPPKRYQILDVLVDSSIYTLYKSWLSCLREDPPNPDALTMIGQLRLAVGMAKIDAAVEVICEVVRGGNPIVVFIYHVEVRKELSRRLCKEGLRVAEIVGETKAGSRQPIVDRFQSGDLDVLIGSEACKEGITLTRAMDCLFVEYWWTPGDMSQGADRIYRIGQTRGVMIRILHAPSTFDDFVRSALKRKRSVIDCFNDRTILDVEDV